MALPAVPRLTIMQKKSLENRGSWNRQTSSKKQQSNAIAKPLGPIPADISGKRTYLESWIRDNRIPGKLQSWYIVPTKAENGDWRILSKNLSRTNRVLSIEGPFQGAKPPKAVLDIDAQIRKPHLTKFRKSILQIWFRATGDGRYGIAVQNILHSAEATREFKTFLEYLQREHADVILCCHQIRIRPVQTLNPTNLPTSSQIELKKGFGSEFLPIGDSGKKYSLIDWTPAAKEPWINLPKRICDAVHPAKDDKFLECFAGPAYIAESLSPHFETCHAIDARDISRITPNVRYIHAPVNKDFFKRFFHGTANEGKWTIYLDSPEGKALATGVVSEIAESRPERILLNASNLAVAAMEIKRFRREGYMLRKIIPLDMEPGTPSFQVLFLFVPDRAGLLGRQNERREKVVKRRETPDQSQYPVESVHFTQKRRH